MLSEPESELRWNFERVELSGDDEVVLAAKFSHALLASFATGLSGTDTAAFLTEFILVVGFLGFGCVEAVGWFLRELREGVE